MINKYSNFGINDNTFKLLFSPYKLQKSEINSSLLNIEKFTMQLSKKNREEKSILRRRVKNSSSSYIYTTENEQIFFKKISDSIRDSITYQVLESENRYGHCHSASLEYASNHDMTNVITAYVESSGFKHLHSWIEKEDKVIDFTKNIIMKKADYYKLVMPQIINSISADNIKTDCNAIKELSFIPIGLYCCFNEEIMRDLEKNKELIKGKPKF